MCADNGVVEEGVTQCGQEVTASVAENFLDEKSCVAIMCKRAGAGIFPVDIGMAVDTPRVEKRKIAYGTKNMTKEPAMTRAQAVAAIEAGIAKAQELKNLGYELLATGEMGIGNTTTSSAMTAVFLGMEPEMVTGRGAGLSGDGLKRKVQAIRRAIFLHEPDASDPLDVLSKVGGFDIAGMCGLFLGGAASADAGDHGWIYFTGGSADGGTSGAGMCRLYSGVPRFTGAGGRYFAACVAKRSVFDM